MSHPQTIQAGSTVGGTIGGTVLVLLMNISTHDLAKTAVLAAVGAAVSFGCSVALKGAAASIKKWHCRRKEKT